MKATTIFAFAASLFLAIGCDSPKIKVAKKTNSSMTARNESSSAAERENADDQPIDMTGVPNEPPPITSTPREFEVKDAKKGKKSRQAGGYLGAIGNARFYAQHKMAENLYIQALNLYWAEKGHYPKTHEEFMEKVIKANKIQLPELEAGVEYLYDPEDHTLKVYRPEG